MMSRQLPELAVVAEDLRPWRLFANQSHKSSSDFAHTWDCKVPHNYNWTIQALNQLHVLLTIKYAEFSYASSCYYNVRLRCIDCPQNKTGRLLCILFTFFS